MNDETTPEPAQWIHVNVHATRMLAEDVVEIELRKADGTELPPFDAGSHLDIELPIKDMQGRNLVRQYSLCSEPSERTRYLVAVGLDPKSRGGSRFVHENLKIGDWLRIGKPRNNFPLDEWAAHTVLIAGGIGVTPLLSMARRLSALGKQWTLYLCVRTPERAAYRDELSALPGKVIQIYDGVAGGVSIDLPAVIGQATEGTHFYCCGPSPMLSAFEAATRHLPSRQVHVEWFKSKESVEQFASLGGFKIRLKKLGRVLDVPADKTILDVLQDAGINVQFSCCQGVCGSCETKVLEGVPHHLDSVLAQEPEGSTDRMMICVSRARSDTLTLDI